MKGKQKLREAAYIIGLISETTNRFGKILNKRQPVNKQVIYTFYRLGKLLKGGKGVST